MKQKRKKEKRLPDEGVNELFSAISAPPQPPPKSRPREPELAREAEPEREEGGVGKREGAAAPALVTDDIIDRAVKEALENPRLSIYSPTATAVVLVVSAREERSLNSVAREVLEEGLRRRYPKLYDDISRIIRPRTRRRLPRSATLR